MKFNVLANLIHLFLVCSSTSVSVPDTGRNPSPAVISFSFQKHYVPFSGDAFSSDGVQKRTDPINQVVTNRVTFYSIDLLFGTPNPQKITLLLDTGSSDTWVNSLSTDYCLKSRAKCIEYGTFDQESSKTFVPGTQGGLNVLYSDHTLAIGNYGTDTISINDKALTGFQFGIATRTNIGHGTLGIGPIGREAEVLQRKGNGYPNFPQALVDQNFIKTKAYSLWFNELGADTGSIVFGGVDTAKFTGKLATFSTQRRNTLALRLNQVSIGNTRSSSFLASIDSGSQNTQLPLDFVQAVWNAVHAIQGQSGGPYVDCNLASSSATMDFDFGATTIRVPLSQLVYKNPDINPPPPSASGTSYCSFGIVAVPKPNIVPVLGGTFLRSAYVVYDLSRGEISVAQTRITSESAIEELDEDGVGKLGGGRTDSDSDNDRTPMFSGRETGATEDGDNDSSGDDGTVRIPDDFFARYNRVNFFPDTGNPFAPRRPRYIRGSRVSSRGRRRSGTG